MVSSAAASSSSSSAPKGIPPKPRPLTRTGKELRKEVAVVPLPVECPSGPRGAAERPARAGRWPRRRNGARLARPVEMLAPLRILENFVCGRDLLELALRGGVSGVHVGVVLPGEPAVGLLDLRVGGAAIHSEYFVRAFHEEDRAQSAASDLRLDRGRTQGQTAFRKSTRTAVGAFVSIAHHRDILSMVLAGGMGERLFPLTRDRAKPAVPFGGRYRIIDFVLNNLVNSGLRKIKVLTQFKSNSLIEHIIRTWRLTFDIGEFVDPVPAQMRRGPHWFRGTADAVYQNLNLIFDEEPRHVCIFGGDHIYTMDVNPMLQFHQEGGHDLTIAALPVPIARGLTLRGPRGRRLGTRHRLRGEAEGAPLPSVGAGARPRLDGKLRLPREFPDRLARARRAAGHLARLRQDDHPRGPSRRRADLRLRLSRRTGCRARRISPRTGGTSEPSTPTGTRRWT